MRLPYQPQTTQYTCVPATQAIALNTLLGTSYTDRDLINLNDGLAINKILFLHELRQLLAQHPQLPTALFVDGMFSFLLRQRRLPTYDECIATYRDTSPKNEIVTKNLEAALLPEHREAFATYCAQLRKGLGPFGYHVRVTSFPAESRLEEQAFISQITEGKVCVYFSEADPHHYPAYCRTHGQSGIIRFPLSRQVLGLPSLSSLDSVAHIWLIDRFEGDSVVLLDTNAHYYDRSPEVLVPSEKLRHARYIAKFMLA